MFTPATITYLKALAANNNRECFNANKQRYEDVVRTPALEFIETMGEPLGRISAYFDANAKKVGGSLMRVHRDTRFARDKTPYKTNIGIQFRHVRGKDVHAPGFYLHIEPGSVFLGAGIWHPESSTLKAVRTLIDEYPKEWQSMRRKVVGMAGFEFGGDSLSRPPRGFNKDHPLIDDLKRKDYIAIRNLPRSSIRSKTFAGDVAAHFKAVSPLVKFICDADDLAF